MLFEDGEFIATNADNTPVLTINAPIGLSLRDNPKPITNGSFVQNDAGDFVGLEVSSGATIALIGGDINFEAGEATAPGGNIELGGLTQAGIVTINSDGSLSFPENITLADITLSNASDVDVRGTGGGSVTVNARNLSLTAGEFGSSFIRTGIRSESTNPQAQAGDINLNATGAIEINNSSLDTRVSPDAVGNSGDINIQANSLSLSDGSSLDVSISGEGSPGNINIDVNDAVTISSGSDIFNNVESDAISTQENNSTVRINAGSLSIDGSGSSINTTTFSQGDAGNINITTDDQVELINGNIFSNVEAGGEGNSGTITINSDSLSLTQGAQIQASVRQADDETPAGEGNAGNINIDVAGEVLISGVSSESQNPSAIFSDTEAGTIGNAGNINIEAGSLTLADGARLDTRTFGTGNPGNITLDVDNAVTISGGADILNVVGQGAVAEDNNSAVTINAGSLSIDGSGSFIDSSTFGTGNAGNINITTDNQVELMNTAAIFSSVEAGGKGNGGTITISSDSLSLIQGAQIQTLVETANGETPAGQGNAGDITINAPNTVSFSGFFEDSEGNIFPSSARSFLGAGARGNAGNITITAGSFSLLDNANLISNTSGTGNPGSITLDVDNAVTISGGADILNRVESGAVAEDNNSAVTINAGSLSIDGSGSSISSSTFGTGNAGNINITTDNQVELIDGNIFSNVGAGGEGKGGTITINSNSLSLTQGGQIQTIVDTGDGETPAGQGNAGNVNLVVAGEVLISGVSDDESPISSGILSRARTGAQGNGGNINIEAGSLTLSDGALLDTRTFGTGNPGNITLDVDNAVTISGGADIFNVVGQGAVAEDNNSAVTINAGSLSIDGSGSSISSSTFGTGNPGSITLDVDNAVTISGGADIFNVVGQGAVAEDNNSAVTINAGSLSIDGSGSSISSSTFGRGNSGVININTDGAVTLSGRANIFNNVESGGQGNSLGIFINAQSLDVTGGAQIQTIVRGATDENPGFGQGNAGNININVRDTVSFSGFFEDSEGTIFSSAAFSLLDEGTTGSAGDINITAQSLFLSEKASLDSSTFGSGNAGDITFNVGDRLQLSGDSLISARSATDSTGGNIIINAPDGFLVAFPSPNNSQGNNIVADAQQGEGGKITINAQGVLGLKEGRANENNGSNDLDASGATNGVVEINTPETDALQGASELPNNPVEPDTTVAQACSADQITQGSSLTVNGKGGIPPQPIEPMNADAILVDGSISSPNPQSQHPEIKPIKTSIGDIYPARGVIVKENGDVILTAYPTDGSDRRTPDIKANCS